MIRVPLPEKRSSNAVVNFTIPVADEEPESPGPLAKVHQEVAGLLGGPGSGWMSRDAHDMHGPGLDLHYEQHVHAPQHGIDMQEVTRQDAGCLGCRNCRHVGGARRGEGPSPAAARIRRTVPSATRYPKPANSPWMRR